MTEYQVSYDYAARSEKEISLQKGEIILVLKQDSSGWAEGVSTARNVQGWFPISFAAPYSGQSTTTPANTSSSSAADKKKDKKGKRMSTRFFSQGREKVKNALAQQAAAESAGSSGGAQEDANESGDFSILDNKKKTSNILTSFLSIRTTKLKEKGMIGDDVPDYGTGAPASTGIYGKSLDVVLEKFGGPIPPLIQQCKEELERTSMKEEGIFRLSGVASQVNQLGREFNKVGATPDLTIDCNAVAGALKKFLREMPEPLFTFEAHNDLLAATQSGNKVEALKECLAQLPRKNYVIIYYLMEFLHRISLFADENKMAASNLGIVFGPTLMRNEEESLAGIMNPMNNPAGTITALIQFFPDIFPEKPEELDNPTPAAASQPEVPVKPRRPTSGSDFGRKESTGQLNLADVMRSRANQSKPQEQPEEAKPPIPAKPVIPPKPTAAAAPAPVEKAPPIPEKPPLPEKPKMPDPKVYAEALYDFTGDASLGQINFHAGDKIEIVKKHQSGWWTGNLNGLEGLVPSNFLAVIE